MYIHMIYINSSYKLIVYMRMRIVAAQLRGPGKSVGGPAGSCREAKLYRGPSKNTVGEPAGSCRGARLWLSQLTVAQAREVRWSGDAV